MRLDLDTREVSDHKTRGAVAGVLVPLLLNLGSIIRPAVNIYAPELTKTEVRLFDVGLSLLSARAESRGSVLGNLGAFQSPQALTIASVSVDTDERSLTSGPS